MTRTIRERDGGFSVYPEQRLVIKTTFTAAGTETQELPWKSVFPEYYPSLFDADYEGDNEWRIDLDCGAMRWEGRQTTKQVRGALRKCGFDKPTIDKLIKHCKQEAPDATPA